MPMLRHFFGATEDEVQAWTIDKFDQYCDNADELIKLYGR